MKFWKILLLSHEMTYTGAPNSLLNVARTLRQHGHLVTIYTLHGGDFVREYHRHGFRVHYYDEKNYTDEQRRAFSKKYDLMIANTVFCAEAAYNMQKNMPTILYLREARNLPDILAKCDIDSRYITDAENVVCVSEYARDFIAEAYHPKRLWTVHNFLIKRKIPKVKKDTDKVNFLIAATVEERKGISVAVDAYRQLPENIRQKACLHIAGRTPDWAESYWRNINLKGDPGVIYHSEISDRKEMDRLIALSDVIVVPSFDESCSLTVLEGAMFGKALIVTENVGAKYMVDDSNGRIVKTGDVKDLSKAIRELTENKDRLSGYGAVSCERFAGECGAARFYKDIKKIFKELR